MYSCGVHTGGFLTVVSQVIAGMQDISRLMTYLHTNQQQVMNLQSFAAHQEYYHLQVSYLVAISLQNPSACLLQKFVYKPLAPESRFTTTRALCLTSCCVACWLGLTVPVLYVLMISCPLSTSPPSLLSAPCSILATLCCCLTDHFASV